MSTILWTSFPRSGCESDLPVEPDVFAIGAQCAIRLVENIAMPLGALEFLMADSFDDFSGRFVSAREVVLAAIGARRYAPANDRCNCWRGS